MGQLARTPSRAISVLLTPLQVQIADIVKELPESEGFALAGAGALLVHGLIVRASRDLDYFTTPGEVEALATLRDALEQTLDITPRRQALIPAPPARLGVDLEGPWSCRPAVGARKP